MIDDERLIDLVRDNEVLYNKSCLAYRFPEKKLAAWAAISRELGTKEKQCTKRWISLRERYTRELRKLDAPSGSAAASQQTWQLLTNLAFLKPFIAPRPNTSYGSLPSEQSSPSPLLFPLVDENETLYPEKLSGNAVPSTPVISKKRKRRDPGGDDEFSEVCQLFKEVQKERLAENRTLRPFGDMIVASIGEMSQRKQAKAIQIITNAVMTLKLEPDD